jgi:hypothetical protein
MKPFKYDGVTNPFDLAEIATSYYYCRKCEADSEELCDEHLYFDDSGDIRWLGNHQLYEH